jgi:hypothetical protein
MGTLRPPKAPPAPMGATTMPAWRMRGVGTAIGQKVQVLMLLIWLLLAGLDAARHHCVPNVHT